VVIVRKSNYITLIYDITIISCFIAFTLNGCGAKKAVEIVYEDSYFSDFYVEDEKVYIECALSVNNATGAEQAVEFVADCSDDVKGGLLKYAELHSYSADHETVKFHIPTGETRIEVIFIGEFAGNAQKQNRLLPNITVV
jgi:hypothetical protein